MTNEQFSEFLAAAKRLADAGEQIVRVLAAYVREETDPQTHAMYTRMLHTVRDCSTSLNLALADAPVPRAAA
jgi:hypothetical protein